MYGFRYYSRKGYPAVNLQALVDSRGVVLDYSLRPGSRADRSVFAESGLGKLLPDILPKHMFIIGDAGYTLSENLMIPFDRGVKANKVETEFNEAFSRTRMPVERAFGALKGRWRILNAVLPQTADKKISLLIGACILLHNLTIRLNDVYTFTDRIDPFDKDWDSNLKNKEIREEDVERREKGLQQRSRLLQYWLSHK